MADYHRLLNVAAAAAAAVGGDAVVVATTVDAAAVAAMPKTRTRMMSRRAPGRCFAWRSAAP